MTIVATEEVNNKDKTFKTWSIEQKVREEE
jgi:hypothetical protein